MVLETEIRSIADVQDIIYHIVSYLDPGLPYTVGSKSARQSLARLARTSRNFSDPALKTLWRSLPDDKPLADLLCTLGIAERHPTPDSDRIPDSELWPMNQQRRLWPSDPAKMQALVQRWRILNGFDYSYVCGSDDPSSHPHWKRFEGYAVYVRVITSLFAFDGPSRCELWEVLVHRIAPVPLLPRLKAVGFRPDRSRRKLVAGSFDLLSRTVTSLEYGGCEYDNPLIRSALTRAFDFAPEIEKVRLPVQPWEDMHVLGDHVHQVEINPEVEPRRLLYLAKFPHLRSLAISLGVYFNLGGSEFACPLLETLDVKGDWTNLIALLNSTNAPNLSVLSLEVWQRGVPPQQVAQYVVECLTTISTRYPSLTSLTVLANSGCPPLSYGYARKIPIVQDTFQVSLLDIVRPILVLRSLRTLTLSFPNYLDIDSSSEDLRAMSEAWPCLEALHVTIWDYFTLKGFPEHPSAGERCARGGPFAAVVHFARNCPRLRTLHLPPMNATQFGVDEALLPCAHSLESLIVSKLKVGEEDDWDQSTERVAKFVRAVFPAAAWVFRKERLAVADGWALVPHEDARCLDCRDLQLSARKF